MVCASVFYSGQREFLHGSNVTAPKCVMVPAIANLMLLWLRSVYLMQSAAMDV